LVELLAVVLIILVLAGIVLKLARYSQTRSLVMRARAEMAELCTALEEYKHDNGDYPRTDQGGSNPSDTIIYTALCAGSKVYYPPKPNQVQAVYGSASKVLVDPWGLRYRFQFSGTGYGGPSYWLETAGPDKQWGTSDDIAVNSSRWYGTPQNRQGSYQR
jgi:type II secretory pathway pseudopilin PulG